MAWTRVTEADIRRAFELWAKTFGFRLSRGFNAKTRRNDPGLILDYEPVYGGYVIGELYTQHTGQGHPFGDLRRTPREFFDVLHFAIRSAEHKKRLRSR